MTHTTDSLDHFTLDIDGDGIATVTIDRANESVNSLEPGLAHELSIILDRCEGDSAIEAVVFRSGKANSFVVGADVRWLATIESEAAAREALEEVHHQFDRIESLEITAGKPVVAAIHGACLGAGLEFALACGTRIASNDPASRFGLPEIQLGLIPGAGGTQRLPALVGLVAGLDLILTGRSLGAHQARSVGVVDEICPVEVLLVTAKKRILESLQGDGATKRPKGRKHTSRTLQRMAIEATPVGRKIVYAKSDRQIRDRTKGHYPAAPAALQAVRAGYESGRDAGNQEEIRQFAKLAMSQEARALTSIFLASQELKHDDGTDSGTAARQVHSVGVVGGGLMGAGIAAVNSIEAQVPTRISEVDIAGGARALAYVERVVAKRAKRRRLTSGQASALTHRVTVGTALSGFANRDLIIEAVFEDLTLKQRILSDVEAVSAADAIFASNTSSIPISQIAANAARPEHVIGMHYFSPVEKMPLLEVIRTPATADWVVATCVEFGKRQGKTVIVVNDAPGFYTTRVLAPYAGEFLQLVSEGVPIDEIDGAMVDFGLPIGPAVLSDEVGIDVQAKIMAVMHEADPDRFGTSELIERLVADGRQGRKNGRGYYHYDNGVRGSVDDTVYPVLGVTPGATISRHEIRDRLVYIFVAEAIRCFSEGVLRSARDGDIGAIMGLGWPPYTGGPFMQVDVAGLKRTVTRMEELAEIHGERFTPPALLYEYASSGRTFRG